MTKRKRNKVAHFKTPNLKDDPHHAQRIHSHRVYRDTHTSLLQYTATTTSASTATMDPDIERIISKHNNEELSPLVLAPYRYLERIPGNNHNMRYRFLVAFNLRFFHIETAAVLEEIGEIIAIFHNASLLIDDIEDSLTLRRGQPCAHTKYGVPLTINSGNLMYFVALQRAITELPKLMEGPETAATKCHANKILVDEMLNLHQGQGLDIYWRDSFRHIWRTQLPSVEDYLNMVMNKTGGLFRLSVKLLALFSSAQVDMDGLIRLANLLGIIYQIRDDYLNLVDEKYCGMKGTAGEDLVEGKLSLPVLHCLLHSGENTPVHVVLLDLATSEERRENSQQVEDAIRFMRDQGSLAYTHELLQQYVQRALAVLGDDESDMLRKIVLQFGAVVEP